MSRPLTGPPPPAHGRGRGRGRCRKRTPAGGPRSRLRPSDREGGGPAPASSSSSPARPRRPGARSRGAARPSAGWAWQPAANARHGRCSRSCQRASRRESERTCSRKRRRPPGRRTLAISSIARRGSSTVQRTRVETTVSKLSSSKGRASAAAGTTLQSRPLRRARRFSRETIGAAGSVRTSFSTASG